MSDVNADGKVFIASNRSSRWGWPSVQKQPPCLTGIKVRASSHLEHRVRLMRAAYVSRKSSATRATSLMPRRSAKLALGQTCGSLRPRDSPTALPDVASHAPAVHPPTNRSNHVTRAHLAAFQMT
jgi:hypothetical protein